MKLKAKTLYSKTLKLYTVLNALLKTKRMSFDTKFANFVINLNCVSLVPVKTPACLAVNLFSMFNDKFSQFRQNASVADNTAPGYQGIWARCKMRWCHNLDKMSTMCVAD